MLEEESVLCELMKKDDFIRSLRMDFSFSVNAPKLPAEFLCANFEKYMAFRTKVAMQTNYL